MATFASDTTPKISDLTHRVALCTMHDIVRSGDTMALVREPVLWMWADVKAQFNMDSFLSRQGYAIKELPDRVTHRIWIRSQAGLDITSAAWVYETFRKSAPRWYKVVGVSETARWLALACHLVEKSDLAPQPRGPLSPQPSSVVL